MNIKQSFLRQDGFSLVEILVTLLILGIAIALALPRLTGSEEVAKNTPSRDRLMQSYEVAQDYYEGEENPHGSLTYQGLNPTRLNRLNSNMKWTFVEPTGIPSSTLKPEDAEKELVWFKNPTTALNYQDLTLCTSSDNYFYCLEEGVTQRGGVVYGASHQSVTQAINNIQASGDSCSSSINKAEGYAEAVKDGVNPSEAATQCGS